MSDAEIRNRRGLPALPQRVEHVKVPAPEPVVKRWAANLPERPKVSHKREWRATGPTEEAVVAMAYAPGRDSSRPRARISWLISGAGYGVAVGRVLHARRLGRRRRRRVGRACGGAPGRVAQPPARRCRAPRCNAHPPGSPGHRIEMAISSWRYSTAEVIPCGRPSNGGGYLDQDMERPSVGRNREGRVESPAQELGRNSGGRA